MHPDNEVWLNPDLIQTVETTPDTVILLTNETRLVVQETPEQVVALVLGWRAGVLARANVPDVVKKVVPLPTT
jgi:flagellar protein FlbD